MTLPRTLVIHRKASVPCGHLSNTGWVETLASRAVGEGYGKLVADSERGKRDRALMMRPLGVDEDV